MGEQLDCLRKMSTTIRSFFNHYGILSISLITMTIFGQFGLRPSQTKYKCLAYFLDIWFICSYTTLTATILHFLAIVFIFIPIDLNQIRNLYVTVYNIIIFITLTLWLLLTFKKYNIFCMLEEVVSIRRAALGKGDIFGITAIITVAWAVFITNGVVNTLMEINWNIPLMQIFFIILKLFFSNMTWMLLWNITFLLYVIALVISSEFQKCISDFKNIIIDEGSLRSNTFFVTEERLRQLTSVVNKVDSMFSFAVGIILTMTLSSLCGAVYAMVIGENPAVWYIAVVYAALSLGLLLLSLSRLNYSVRNLPDIL